MFACPNCGKELDVSPRMQPPWWKYEPGQTANLGCGTLILIAIIVAMFSGDRGASRQIDQLTKEVRSLQEKVDALRKEK